MKAGTKKDDSERMKKKEKIMRTTQEQTQTNRHQMKKMMKEKDKRLNGKHRGKLQKSVAMHSAPSDKDEESQEKRQQ